MRYPNKDGLCEYCAGTGVRSWGDSCTKCSDTGLEAFKPKNAEEEPTTEKTTDSEVAQ